MAPPTPTSAMLVTGEYFDHLAPDPNVINLDVLEHGLDVPRFNNQTIRPLTTLEHSLRVARIARELAHESLLSWASSCPPGSKPSTVRPPGAQDVGLWGLLHDAHEALVPWGDCLRPGKTPEMREAEERVDVAIVESIRATYARPISFGVVWPPPSWPEVSVREIVKTADSIALYFEAMLWQPGADDWAWQAWPPASMLNAGEDRPSRDEQIERFLPLIAPRPGECWRTEVEALLGKQ